MNATASSSGAGRPRDAQIDEAVTAATLELLDEEGYLGVTFGEVARRAGTSRPAIYRRHSSRAELVLAAIEGRLSSPTPPDHGCTLCDVGDALTLYLDLYRTIAPEVFTALYADCAQDPDLRERYLQVAIEPTRGAVRTTLGRAVERGDLRPDVDVELLLDIVASLTHFRVLAGEHQSNVEADSVVTALLRGAALDYDALVEHSRSLASPHPDGAAHC